MKSIKKLIIASALSMMAASCYAGSFLPNTEQQKSVDISFAAPEHLTISLDQAPGLIAGKGRSDMVVAKLTVNSNSIKEYGVRGISSSMLNDLGNMWNITGKNSGNTVAVGFSNKSLVNSHGLQTWNGLSWYTFDANDPLDIVLVRDQDISPDTYPLTVDVVGYQP
ncbi:TPA: pilus assembly protein [Salmonella enterica subsp. enterica serovar Anfo]|nr:pilus assembly protein [Salmonella enterica]ECC3620475.1 pilus assembly protein [Salmonella enterica subsp. enterica]HBJ6181623.1 pilus assembly protein [Salmonella enterica subsp. enterica serovar Anfo]EAP6103025.1 pilus assembly protein [Salmonella enterica]EAV6675723.1 pilus assembly protein [Salmonella enterica]